VNDYWLDPEGRDFGETPGTSSSISRKKKLLAAYVIPTAQRHVKLSCPGFSPLNRQPTGVLRELGIKISVNNRL
jgi:hypothetical protein